MAIWCFFPPIASGAGSSPCRAGAARCRRGGASGGCGPSSSPPPTGTTPTRTRTTPSSPAAASDVDAGSGIEACGWACGATRGGAGRSPPRARAPAGDSEID